MLILISILIIAHEFGHFWVARKCGIRVEKFGFGLPFGPVLWSKKVGNTEYCIYPALFGGFVSFPDDDPESDLPEDSPERLENKTVLQRFAVMVAGVTVNAFLGWLIMVAVIMAWGLPSSEGADVTVQVMGDRTGAAIAGLKNHDQIVAIDGQDVNNFERERATRIAKANALLSESKEGHVLLTVLKNVNTNAEQPSETDPLKPQIYETEKVEVVLDGKGGLGIGFKVPEDQVGLAVASVTKNSPGSQAKLTVGDKITEINHIPLSGDIRLVMERLDFVQEMIKGHKGEHFSMTIQRGDTPPFDIDLTTNAEGKIGVQLIPGRVIYEKESNVLVASAKSAEYLSRFIVLNFEMMGKIITGQADTKMLSGPIGIVAEGGRMIDQNGIQQGLILMAIISTILAVMNLLPIPALDGGHIFFLFIEALKGSPVKREIQETAVQFGFISLLLLMGFVVFNDVNNYFIHPKDAQYSLSNEDIKDINNRPVEGPKKEAHSTLESEPKSSK